MQRTRKKPGQVEISAWDRFCENHAGVYPPTLAAARLKLTLQGVYAAADRGWIAFFMIGHVRYYSRRDVESYRWTGSRKFRDNRPRPLYSGKKDETLTS